MSRPRKYTPNTLKKAVNGYFDSISRLVPLTEKRNTGRKDSDGHVIYEEVPVLNRLGVQATVRRGADLREHLRAAAEGSAGPHPEPRGLLVEQGDGPAMEQLQEELSA